MWELDCEESWDPKNWCFWTVVLEKTLESPLDCKKIQLVHSKGDQSWVFIGRTDAEAETPICWPTDAKSWVIWKDPDVGKDWRQEEKGTTEAEMARWHHRLNGHEFEWTLGDGDGQGGLVCCNSWGCKELNTTEQLNWTELNSIFSRISFSLKGNPVICNNMDEPRRHKWNKPITEGQVHDCTYMRYLRVKPKEAGISSTWESQGWGSLVGCRLWGRTESDATEAT